LDARSRRYTGKSRIAKLKLRAITGGGEQKMSDSDLEIWKGKIKIILRIYKQIYRII
jgi:hypothetical protein